MWVSEAQCFKGTPRLGIIPKIIIKISPKCKLCLEMPWSAHGCLGMLGEYS